MDLSLLRPSLVEACVSWTHPVLCTLNWGELIPYIAGWRCIWKKESEAHSRTLADARSPADPCLLLGLGYTWEYVGAV